MNKKFYFFCIFLLVFSVVFHGFSALETGSGSGSNSGSMNAPLVKYKEWQVGRSDTGTDKNKAEHLSFITSTGTSCQFSASVGYQGGSQPQNTSPIDPDTVKWDVIDANHSMTFDKSSVSKNWSGKHPSKFDTSTSFNVVAKVTVPRYKTDTSCTANDANRADRTPVRFRQRHRRAALVNRYCATHHDCHHTGNRHSAIPLCQHSAPHVHFAPTPDCPSNLRITTLQPKFLYNFTSLCGIIDVTQYYSYNTISGYISLLCSTNC